MTNDSGEAPDGLIIIVRCCPAVIRRLQKSYKNIVAINRNSANYAIDEVICDGKKIASLTVSHLVSLGHEKIAYVGKCHQERVIRDIVRCCAKMRLIFTRNM